MIGAKKETARAGVTAMKHYCSNCGSYGTLIEWMCPECYDDWIKEEAEKNEPL
jgi:DnaJ-class molecular chaperone